MQSLLEPAAFAGLLDVRRPGWRQQPDETAEVNRPPSPERHEVTRADLVEGLRAQAHVAA